MNVLIIGTFEVFSICPRTVSSVINQKYRVQSLDRCEATHAKPASGTAGPTPMVPPSAEARTPAPSSPTV